ncbi:hypothetical protein H6503_06655 [Candidatus Woesearchaeota archaeon]|nr:hypothetical protein [Candidatus Woesearchaeota archaeon]
MRENEANKFWLINGWIVIIIVCLTASFYFLGIFEFIKYSTEECMLGDGLVCKYYAAETNSTGISTGENTDIVIFHIENNLGQELKSFSILATECEQESLKRINVKEGDYFLYNITNCKNIHPHRFFESALTVRYVTSSEEKNISHLSQGRINVHSISPLPENFQEKIAKDIRLWMQKNIG